MASATDINLQPFYEVVPNYMTGGVIVSVISQHYTHPGPYNNRSRVENATRSGFPTANPLALMLGWVLGNNYPDIFSDEAKCDRIPGHELGLQPFQLRAPQYASLCRPWMEMAWMCGFGLSSSTTHGNFINLSPHKYFSVDLLWFENPYPPLAMYWKHFVWFALTVSVDLNDLPKEEANFTLEDRHELLVLQRKNASFTIRNRHQHATIMSVSVTEGNWNRLPGITPCVFKASKATKATIRPYARSSAVAMRLNLMINSLFFDTNVDLDADDHPKALAAAITWLFYCNNFSPDERDSSIPISQRLLEIREKSLCSLKKLDEEGNLKSAISALFGDSAEPGSSAIESGPTRILELLESLISASHYMKDRGCFRGTLYRLKEDVDKHQVLSLCDEDIESLERICKGLPGNDFFRRTTEPNPQSGPGAPDRLGSRLATRTLEAKASSTFEGLRSLSARTLKKK
ncbi:hypothetical protein IWX91DRAFT_318286 [Phyllosticta citricarpa]